MWRAWAFVWDCEVLWLQGLLCYAPKWIWDQWEDGLMKTLCTGLQSSYGARAALEEKKKRLLDYLVLHFQVR